MRALNLHMIPASALDPVKRLIAAREEASVNVDALVMAVTESLCLMEKESSAFMALPENRERKALLLAKLGELDRLMGALRNSTNAICGFDVPMVASNNNAETEAEVRLS